MKQGNLRGLLLGAWLALSLGACAVGGPGANVESASGELVRPSSELPTNSTARKSAQAHIELGNMYLLAGKNGVALDEAKLAITADSNYAPGYLLKALVYADQEQYAFARPAFEEAARLAPGDPEINNAYGWFLCSQGQENDGLIRLESAARNPYYKRTSQAWTNAGLCLLRKKDEAGAEERFLRATRDDAKNIVPQERLALLAYQSGRLQRAKMWIDTVQQNLKRPNVDVLWLAARIEKKLGNDALVKSYGEKLYSEFPGSNEYQLYLQGKFE